jgi:LmbE family N-acetylglucosaminyl deacetylase
MIRTIRHFRPDLVLTHRANDYHPDHRATSLLVQDAAYMLTVPSICPDAPHLRRDPVIAYLSDDFTKPCPFEPTVVVDISAAWDAKVAMLDAHRSQFYEWLPYNGRYESEVPKGDDAGLAWLSARMAAQSARLADRFRSALLRSYGHIRGADIQLVEAFEASEYGAPLDAEAAARLFPFLTETPT